jgi:sigma-54 specific flagellar transcriptional regulator A
MRDMKLLVVDNDTKRLELFCSILRFLGAGQISVSDFGRWSSSDDFDGLFINEAGIVAEIARIEKSGIDSPVFCFGDGDSDLPASVLGHIASQPSYAELMSALHRMQIVHSSRHGATSNAKLKQVLVGNSPAIRSVRQQIEQVANTEANVLILGESGTGKEVVASSLHYLSKRQNSNFVPVNCGAIPGELLESELFGHEKGAFTGAISARQGRFEVAEGGSLFLDEIGDMPMPMQVKLLRVLQERTFERVGSNKTMQADVRVIAATHRELESHIKEGTFREDLFFRLNVFPIEIPALRERSEDIPLLINELVARLARDGRDGVQLTWPAIESLKRYKWPGNVRELANLMERLTIMFPNGVVDYDDLPLKFQMEGVDRSGEPPIPVVEAAQPVAEEPIVATPVTSIAGELPEEGLDLKEYLAELEQDYIQQAIERADGVVSQAAKLLNIQRTTLVEKMKKYGLQRAE